MDKIQKKEVKILHCLMKEIVADFSSKVLQGKIFVMHCNTMLGMSLNEFNTHGEWNKEALKEHNLQDAKEEDLF